MDNEAATLEFMEWLATQTDYPDHGPEWEAILGDSLERLKGLPDNYFDSMVMDPPAGISFMGKDWDHHKGGRDKWIAWLAAILRECLRVTKPGGHAVVWALPRTSFWTGMALDDAGWEVRDVITHLFGSGFPKSHDVSKALDKAAGAERAVVGKSRSHGLALKPGKSTYVGEFLGSRPDPPDITAPATAEAAQWEGWGTALKPAAEFWYIARKPFTGTVAANVLEWGVGGFNIDGSRINNPGPHGTEGRKKLDGFELADGDFLGGMNDTKSPPNAGGRWPANVVLSHTPECRQVGTRRVRGAGWQPQHGGLGQTGTVFTSTLNEQRGKSYADDEGLETVADWECSDECPVAMLDRQSGTLHSGERKGPNPNATKSLAAAYDGGWEHTGGASVASSGGASRFFYQAKPSPKERNMGLDGLPQQRAGAYGEFAGDGRGRQTEHSPAANTHPTVKSIRLMTYLIKLVTPAGGRVGDPFMGSGSTGVACVLGGWRFWGCDKERDHVTIARARIAHAVAHPELWRQFLKDIGPDTEDRQVSETTETPEAPQPAPPRAVVVSAGKGRGKRKAMPDGVEQLNLF